jgi:hypothetical protein
MSPGCLPRGESRTAPTSSTATRRAMISYQAPSLRPFKQPSLICVSAIAGLVLPLVPAVNAAGGASAILDGCSVALSCETRTNVKRR